MVIVGSRVIGMAYGKCGKKRARYGIW